MANERELKELATTTSDQRLRFTGERWPTARGSWTIFPQLCKGCGLCIERCPVGVIKWAYDLGAYGANRVTVDADDCITCKICASYCPDAAISVVVKEPLTPASRGKPKDEN